MDLSEEFDRDARIWITAFISALASYIFASVGFTGVLDFMALGGFMICFGALMIAATFVEERLLED